MKTALQGPRAQRILRAIAAAVFVLMGVGPDEAIANMRTWAERFMSILEPEAIWRPVFVLIGIAILFQPWIQKRLSVLNRKPSPKVVPATPPGGDIPLCPHDLAPLVLPVDYSARHNHPIPPVSPKLRCARCGRTYDAELRADDLPLYRPKPGS